MSKAKYWGQVWTPKNIANIMATSALMHLNPQDAIRVLDPCAGEGVLLETLNLRVKNPSSQVAIEIDPSLYTRLKSTLRNAEVINSDYLATNLLQPFDLIIMNPPYVRHELIGISDKNNYNFDARKSTGIRISKRSNLYVYFIIKAITELKLGGVFSCIVYDSILHTSYGQDLVHFIDQQLEIKFFRSIKKPFKNALVDAVIFTGRKVNCGQSKSPLSSQFQITKHLKNNRLINTTDTALENLLFLQRGTDLKRRAHSLTTELIESIPIILRTPNPPALKAVPNSAVIPTEVKRQNIRFKTGQLLVNYYLRTPPRHLWNSQKVPASDNFFVIKKVEKVTFELAWLLLNSSEYSERIFHAGRPQGNGLFKLQVSDYKSVLVPDWRKLSSSQITEGTAIAKALLKNDSTLEVVRKAADTFIKEQIDEF